MPRGVYDRSKLKKTKTEAAPAAAKAPKGKPGRKPGSGTKSASPAKSETKTYSGGDAFGVFATLRANIDTLSNVAEKFGTTVPGVVTEIAAHVELLSNLRKQTFGTGESKKVVEEKAEASNGAATAQQTAPYAATVPMPPSPIPSISTPH